MTTFTTIVILGVLMIIGGLALLTTPLTTYVGAGYFIIILFFVWGIFNIVRGISEKRYDKKFFFAILSLILGVVGLVVPGAAAMNNFVMLYIAAGWFFIRGILTILDAIASREEGVDGGMRVLGIIMGVVEIALAVYSIAHPAVLAVSLGILIGLYFIESGVSAILIGKAACIGGNSMTIVFTVIGVLTIIGGISMLATPLTTFLGTGRCIIMLFFISGVLGIVRAIAESRYDRDFFFAILSLILGIIGIAVPGIAEMNNSILLYMAAGWFFIHGVMTIIRAIASNNPDAGAGARLLGIVLGVLELIMGVYSIAHPAVLAVGMGVLIGLYFIETGVNFIFIGSAISSIVTIGRTL